MLSGKISFPLIGISGVAILVLSGAVTLQAGFSGFVDKNVIMLAGMFAMAAQFSRTSFIEKLKSKLLSGKASKNDTILMFTLLAFSAILAQFTNSQSSIIMLMMSFLISIGRDSEVTMSRVLLPMVLVMTAWMAKLPVGGGGLTTYLMLNQFIEAAGGVGLLRYHCHSGYLSAVVQENEMTNVLTPAGGIFRRFVEPGQEVEYGQTLGVILDPFTAEEVAKISCPTSGVIFFALKKPLTTEHEVAFKVIRRLHGGCL